MAYVSKAFRRLSRLGIQIVVFGSGGARRVPDGFPKDEAFRSSWTSASASRPRRSARGITSRSSRSGSQETNIINTAAEGLDAGRGDRTIRTSS